MSLRRRTHSNGECLNICFVAFLVLYRLILVQLPYPNHNRAWAQTQALLLHMEISSSCNRGKNSRRRLILRVSGGSGRSVQRAQAIRRINGQNNLPKARKLVSGIAVDCSWHQPRCSLPAAPQRHLKAAAAVDQAR